MCAGPQVYWLDKDSWADTIDSAPHAEYQVCEGPSIVGMFYCHLTSPLKAEPYMPLCRRCSGSWACLS